MDSIDKERNAARRQQSKVVMPLIGVLLDRWDDLPNDVKSDPELDAIAEIINKIDNGMEGII